MFVFLIGQSLGAIAWNYDIMMISRIITGIASASAFELRFPFLRHWFTLIQGEKLHQLYLQV